MVGLPCREMVVFRVPVTGCAAKLCKVAYTVRRATACGRESSELTTGFSSATSPVVFRYTGFQMPAFLSGTKEASNKCSLVYLPLYPRYFQLIQSNQLSASSTPSTSCTSRSGVTLTASPFGAPGLIHWVTL